jgi:hypothetical protein
MKDLTTLKLNELKALATKLNLDADYLKQYGRLSAKLTYILAIQEAQATPEEPVIAEEPVETLQEPEEPVIAEEPVETLQEPEEPVIAEEPVETLQEPEEPVIAEEAISYWDIWRSAYEKAVACVKDKIATIKDKLLETPTFISFARILMYSVIAIFVAGTVVAATLKNVYRSRQIRAVKNYLVRLWKSHIVSII